MKHTKQNFQTVKHKSCIKQPDNTHRQQRLYINEYEYKYKSIRYRCAIHTYIENGIIEITPI